MAQDAQGPAVLEMDDAEVLLGGTATSSTPATAAAGGLLQRLRAVFQKRRQLPQRIQMESFLDTHLPRARGFERLAEASKLSSASSRWVLGKEYAAVWM
jgi:hypothetical protein